MAKKRFGLLIDDQKFPSSDNRLDLLEFNSTRNGVYFSPMPGLFAGTGLHGYVHNPNERYPEHGFGFKTYNPLFKTPSLTLGQLTKNLPSFFNEAFVGPEPGQEALITVINPKKLNYGGMITKLGKYVLVDSKKLSQEVLTKTYYLSDTAELLQAVNKLKSEGILKPNDSAIITTSDSISYYVCKKQILPTWASEGAKKDANELGGLILTSKKHLSRSEKENTLGMYGQLFNPHEDRFFEFFDNMAKHLATTPSVKGFDDRVKAVLSSSIINREIREL